MSSSVNAGESEVAEEQKKMPDAGKKYVARSPDIGKAQANKQQKLPRGLDNTNSLYFEETANTKPNDKKLINFELNKMHKLIKNSSLDQLSPDLQDLRIQS